MDQQRYQQLLRIAKIASSAYYEHDDPVMLDCEYDGLMRQLEEIEKQHPEWVDPNSPTKVVGGKAVYGFAKVEHITRMLSLKNAYTEDEVATFCIKAQERMDANKAQRDYPRCKFVVEPKLDGLTIVCKYDHGIFMQAVTRGDGLIGEDVTANAMMLQNLPKFYDTRNSPYGIVYLRGEVVLPKVEFARLNKELVAKGLQPMANERNAAAGALRQSDPQVTRQRRLHVMFYDMWAFSANDGKECFLDEIDKLRFMTMHNIPNIWSETIIAECTDKQKPLKSYPDYNAPPQKGMVAYFAHGSDEPVAQVNEAIAWFCKARYALPYATDGAVIKVNDLFIQYAMGGTDKYPHWAIAFKFEQPQYDTFLRKVTWNVGRTGKVTPVAEFDPVIIDGTEVKNATLNNPYYIRSLGGLREGDMIAVYKAAQIIPQVASVVCKNQNAPELEAPKFCPSCGTELTHDGQSLVCPCKVCDGKVIARIDWFVSKQCMDIRGLGHAVVADMHEELCIDSPADLYMLTPGTLMEHCGYTENTAKKLVDSITASKSQPFAKVLAAIGIEGVGTTKAFAIASKYNTMDAFMQALDDGTFKMSGIGPIGVKDMRDSLHDPYIISLIHDLRGHGLKFENDVKVRSKEGKLAGKSFVITGKLRNVRTMYVAMIRQNGGTVHECVTKNTSFLIAGEGGGSKRIMAQKFDVPVISEDEFMEMMK